MLILTIRTDNPMAELGLYDSGSELVRLTWQAHRQLAETIHNKIDQLLKETDRELTGIEGIVVFQGPGSFTGLRIGMSVANALADGLSIPIVGTMGEEWLKDGLHRLQAGENDTVVIPIYGADPHVTQPKH